MLAKTLKLTDQKHDCITRCSLPFYFQCRCSYTHGVLSQAYLGLLSRSASRSAPYIIVARAPADFDSQLFMWSVFIMFLTVFNYLAEWWVYATSLKACAEGNCGQLRTFRIVSPRRSSTMSYVVPCSTSYSKHLKGPSHTF